VSVVFEQVKLLVERGDVKVSDHGYNQFVLVARFQEPEKMKTKSQTRLVHVGEYVAEVDVELLETDNGWSPYLSLDDAYKLDDVREALRRGDVKTAALRSRVYSLTPVSA
jgi:hypothetical protein